MNAEPPSHKACRRRQTDRTLLPADALLQAGRTSWHRAPALGQREYSALDARRCPRRGSRPVAKRQRSGELGCPATLGTEYCARSPQFQSLHARQAQAGWMGRKIPPRDAYEYAIALLAGGGIAEVAAPLNSLVSRPVKRRSGRSHP